LTAKVVEASKDNPVFYLQYAHARICSTLRKGAAEGFAPRLKGWNCLAKKNWHWCARARNSRVWSKPLLLRGAASHRVLPCRSGRSLPRILECRQ
jgi:hypothetical protein